MVLRQGYDPCPPSYELSILTSELPERLARLAEIESATYGLEGRCSILLSYRRIVVAVAGFAPAYLKGGAF